MTMETSWSIVARRIQPAACGIGLLVIAATQQALAQTGATTSLHQRQREQERARAMASELATSILDIQLRQLAENNLQELPIYGEIKSMRTNIHRLVERDMPDVVELLVQAQRASDKDREQIAVAARGRVRTVVVALMAERQKLAKRMHLARLAAQTRQLIEQESKVLGRTRSLSAEESQVRERATLATLEDQRDVTAIYFQFVDTLTDVATWDGPVGAGAAQGLALMRTLKVDQELRGADLGLTNSRYADAEKAEQSAIRAWRALLEIIEQTQGLAGGDRDAAQRLVADLIKRQESVREQTRQADGQDLQRAEQLAQSEHEIHRGLGELASELDEAANAGALVEQAKAAAFEAESRLFEGNIPPAVQRQSEVIGALAEIEKKLAQASQATSDKTADQLAQEVKQLEQLDQALQPIRGKQVEVAAQAGSNAPAARAAEDHVAQLLQQANQAADFGPALETRLSDAQDQVSRTRESLANAAPEQAGQRQQSATDSLAAIDVVASEVKHAVADLRRRQLGVAVGELARAAEALERAAAAEHRIGETARAAASAEGFSADQAASLGAEQELVQKVAQQIAAGVTNTAPQAAQQLRSAEPSLSRARQQLQAAQQNPGAAGKDAARQAGDAAREGSAQLANAARLLRHQAGVTATELARMAGEQLKPVAEVREAVDNTLATLQQEDTNGPADALSAALAKTQAAQLEQLRAAGRQEAAEAREVLGQLDRAVRQQATAEEFARDYSLGRSNSPLRAATAQRQVGQQVAEFIHQADPSLLADLKTAIDAAEEAAKEWVIGNPNQAAMARGKAREALGRAVQQAQKAAEDAMQLPPRDANPDSQQRVSKLVQDAQTDLGDSAAPAREALANAQRHSETASKAMADRQSPAATDAQAKTAVALDQSAQTLQQAIAAESARRADRARDWARQTARLTDLAVPVDAGAVAALKQATAAAAKAAERDSTTAAALDSSPGVTRGLERATASLGAREQELQRDREIAEAIASLAREQQAARDQIADLAAKLEKLADQNMDDAKAPAASPEAVDAAQGLADAADKFAEAQRATGEGAAEISQQREVANQPIRQGLEDASQLAQLPENTAAQPGESPDPNTDPGASREGEQNASAKPGENGMLRELGTGFVPRSPEETARRIAGQEALEEAAKALAQQSPNSADPLSGDQSKPSQSRVSQNSDAPQDSQPTPAETTAAAKKGEAAMATDQQGQNEPLDPSRLEQDPAARERDSRTGTGNDTQGPESRGFQAEPWFAKLPPALQKALQSKSRRAPPRGYEERLKRYFEN